MTNSIDVLSFDSILMDVKATSTKQVFQKLSAHIHRLIGTPESKIMDGLMAQEKDISSAVGHGISIPHMKLPRLTRPMVIFAKLSNAIDFKGNDGEWVDMVCLVLSPEYEGPKHLQRLAFVTRAFNNQEFIKNLKACENADDVKIALNDLNAQRLAA